MQNVAPVRPSGLPASSLIVCSRNRPEMLAATVASVLQGEVVPTELIIIDQSDEPQQDLQDLTTDRECEVRYHWTQSVGLSRACNAGIAAATFDLLVFTHDDVLVTSSWFDTIVRSLLSHGERAIVTGRVMPEERAEHEGFVPSTKVDEEPAVYEGRTTSGVLYPMNMAMYRSAVDEVGAFDVHLGPGTPFPAAEDNDFCFRLLEAGYRIVYDPEAMLYHRAWRSGGDLVPLRWAYGLGQGAFYAKHMSREDRYTLRLFGWELQHRGRRLLRRIGREPRRSGGEVVYLLGLCAGVLAWLLTQRRRS